MQWKEGERSIDEWESWKRVWNSPGEDSKEMEEDERPGSWGLGDDRPDEGWEIQGQAQFLCDRSRIRIKSIRINGGFFFYKKYLVLNQFMLE